MQTLVPYIQKIDDRGGFWGITQDHWAEVNFIETGAEQVRGQHYHKETRELFFIIEGEIEVVIDSLQSGEHTEMVVTKGDVFIIEPYELHTFRTRTEAKWLNMLSKRHEPQDPDFHKQS